MNDQFQALQGTTLSEILCLIFLHTFRGLKDVSVRYDVLGCEVEKKGRKPFLCIPSPFPTQKNPHIITHDIVAATMQPSMAAGAAQPAAVSPDHTTDLILQIPLAAGFAVLVSGLSALKAPGCLSAWPSAHCTVQ
jgi:hypothetical protein